MRHRVKKFTLGREKAQRDALMRNLADSLILHGGIVTTKAKARALRTYVEPLVTKARQQKPSMRRMISKSLYTGKAIKKLIEELGPRYKDRDGGYTRIVKMGFRANDKGEKVKIEFV